MLLHASGKRMEESVHEAYSHGIHYMRDGLKRFVMHGGHNGHNGHHVVSF
jgi:hypothetical protein